MSMSIVATIQGGNLTNAFLTESAVSRQLQSQLLADAIPAGSLPAGFTSVPSWGVDNPFGQNIDMAAENPTPNDTSIEELR